MVIEEKINDYINQRNDFEKMMAEINNLKPYYIYPISTWLHLENLTEIRRRDVDYINKIIDKADLTECLTSNSEYIRECKKWYMEEK